MVTIKIPFLKLEVWREKTSIFQREVNILTSFAFQSNMALRSAFPPCIPTHTHHTSPFLTNRSNIKQKSACLDYLCPGPPLPVGRRLIFPWCLILSILTVWFSQRPSWESALCVLNIMVKTLQSCSLERELSRLVCLFTLTFVTLLQLWFYTWAFLSQEVSFHTQALFLKRQDQSLMHAKEKKWYSESKNIHISLTTLGILPANNA